MPCVSYWRSQLSASNIKNLKNGSEKTGGTKKSYTYGLHGFHRWICSKKLQYTAMVQTGRCTFNMQKKTVTLKGIDHFLNLYQCNVARKTEFAALIKKYLIDLQSLKGTSTVDNAMFAIKSFFRENDSEIDFRFNNNKNRNDPMIENAMTLNDLKKILSVNGIQPVEKAVFLCKFQRGLDSATFADRFNFDAWPQITSHFGTDNPDLWDISKCPVPIKLVRVKTNYLHTGFLDVDAIVALQEYLKKRIDEKTAINLNLQGTRERKTGIKNGNTKPLKSNNMLFLDTKGNPISINWIGRRFGKLRKRAGLNGKMYTSHEMRDLLKSTLIDSNCRPDIADHVIGHAPKDSYEKQALLYPNSLRTEFMKASDRINVLTLSVSHKNSSSCRVSNSKHDHKHGDISIIEELFKINLRISEILLQIQSDPSDNTMSNMQILISWHSQ